MERMTTRAMERKRKRRKRRMMRKSESECEWKKWWNHDGCVRSERWRMKWEMKKRPWAWLWN
jgi:hypothetical protein